MSFGRIPPDQLLGSLPTWLKVVAVCVAAYVFVDFFLMFTLLPGQPVEQGGGYFLNNHGSFSPISKSAYLQDLMYGARLFSGHAIVFSGIAALVGFQLDRIRRGHVVTGPPISTSLPPPGLPPPFARSARLQTILSPEQCAERLKAYISRAPSWIGTRGRRDRQALAGSVSERGFNLSLPYGNGSGMVSAAGIFVATEGATVVDEVISFKRWYLASMLAAYPIMLGLMFIAFHGFTGLFAVLLAGVVVVTAVNVGVGLRDMSRLQSNIRRALGLDG